MTDIPHYDGNVIRLLFALLSATVAAFAANPAREAVLGVRQQEIKLVNGTVFKDAKVLDASLERGTATITDAMQLRTVPLQQLPASLREQVVAEVSRPNRPRYNIYRVEPVRPPPPPDRAIPPAAPLVPPVTPTIIDQLIARAALETPDELKLHLLRGNQQLSSLTTKIRKVEQVPGWQKIRTTGDAAFSVWDNSRRDYGWRTEKFEVEFDIIDGNSLRISSVTFGGITRRVDVEP
ncbi:MAG: hypothetical protein WD941_03500 [Opitutus sp.]